MHVTGGRVYYCHFAFGRDYQHFNAGKLRYNKVGNSGKLFRYIGFCYIDISPFMQTSTGNGGKRSMTKSDISFSHVCSFYAFHTRELQTSLSLFVNLLCSSRKSKDIWHLKPQKEVFVTGGFHLLLSVRKGQSTRRMKVRKMLNMT